MPPNLRLATLEARPWVAARARSAPRPRRDGVLDGNDRALAQRAALAYERGQQRRGGERAAQERAQPALAHRGDQPGNLAVEDLAGPPARRERARAEQQRVALHPR